MVVLVTVIVALAVVVLVCPGRDLSVFVFVGLALITLVVAVVVIFRFTLVSGLPLWLHAVHVGVLLQHPHHWNMVSGIQLWLGFLCCHFTGIHDMLSKVLQLPRKWSTQSLRSLFKVHARDKQRNRPNQSICDLTASSTEAL